MPSKEKAAWWIEYAIRNKDAPHLKLSFSQHQDIADKQYLMGTWTLLAIVLSLNVIFILLTFSLYTKYQQMQAKPKLF